MGISRGAARACRIEKAIASTSSSALGLLKITRPWAFPASAHSSSTSPSRTWNRRCATHCPSPRIVNWYVPGAGRVSPERRGIETEPRPAGREIALVGFVHRRSRPSPSGDRTIRSNITLAIRQQGEDGELHRLGWESIHGDRRERVYERRIPRSLLVYHSVAKQKADGDGRRHRHSSSTITISEYQIDHPAPARVRPRAAAVHRTSASVKPASSRASARMGRRSKARSW